MNQIVDIVEAGIPGGTGDVTPAAIAAREAAQTAQYQAQAARDQAQLYAASTIELQDAAMTGVLSESISDFRQKADELYKGLELSPEIRLLITEANGTPVLFKGDPDRVTGQSLWSITKVVNALTFAKLMAGNSGWLSDTVTITAPDIAKASSSAIAVGDKITVEDLLYLAALPSDNLAPVVLARHAADTALTVPSWSNPYNSFLGSMNSYLESIGIVSGGCMTVYSRSLLSMRSIVQVMRNLQLDPVLSVIYAAKTRLITVTGDNPRTFTVEHSANPLDDVVPYDSRGVSKTGTGVVGTIGGFGNVAFRYTAEGVSRYCVIMGAQPVTSRFTAAATAVAAVAAGSRYRELSTPVNSGSGNAPEQDTMWWDITHLFDGLGRNGAGSGVFIRRVGGRVTLKVNKVSIPGNNGLHLFAAALPQAYQPDTLVRFPVTLSDRSNSHTVIDITESFTGGTPFDGNASAEVTIAGNSLRLDIRNFVFSGNSFSFLSTAGIPWAGPGSTVFGQLVDIQAPYATRLLRVTPTGVVNYNPSSNPGSLHVDWALGVGHNGEVTCDAVGGVQFTNAHPLSVVSGVLTWDVAATNAPPRPTELIGLSLTAF